MVFYLTFVHYSVVVTHHFGALSGGHLSGLDFEVIISGKYNRILKLKYV